MEYDTVIVGGGPAGVSAAIYAKRSGVSVLVIDKGMIGGQVMDAADIENYPGFPRIKGAELAMKFAEHLRSLEIPTKMGSVEKIERMEKGFKVSVGGEEVSAKSVVLALGSHHRHLNVPGEKELAGRGVSYCATCDGFFFKDKVVAVVGGGNTAVTYALYLADIASKVYLIHRREGFRAEQVLVDRMKSNEKIELVLNYVVERIEGKDKVERVILKNTKDQSQKELDLDGIFISIGEIPNSDIAKGMGVELDERGYIKTDERQRTSVEGVFAAGDVCGKGPAQILNAAAQGMIAGLEAAEFAKASDQPQ